MSDRTRQRRKQECDDTEHKNRPSRAELVARAVPLQPVLREHAGTGEADGRGSGPSPDRRRLLPHLHTDQNRRLRGGHPNRGYADRARSRAMGGYAAQQTLEAIHTLLNVHGAGGFAEKNRMQQYRRDANTAARHPGLNAVVGRVVSGKSLLAVEERISPVV